MGLDMYLSRKIYVKNWSPDPKFEINITFKGNPTSIDSKRVTYITEEIGYWRKANAIHNWFVKNVQSGDDDCGEYYVGKEQFEKLISDCQHVLNNQDDAENILPTAIGFFFGSTSYDDYYFEDIRNTIKICQDALKLMEDEDIDGDFYYQASW